MSTVIARVTDELILVGVLRRLDAGEVQSRDRSRPPMNRSLVNPEELKTAGELGA